MKGQSEKKVPEPIQVSPEESAVIANLSQYYPPWEKYMEDWVRVYHVRASNYNTMEYNNLVETWPALANNQIACSLVGLLANILVIIKFLNNWIPQVSVDFKMKYPNQIDFHVKWDALARIAMSHERTIKMFTNCPSDGECFSTENTKGEISWFFFRKYIFTNFHGIVNIGKYKKN